MSHFLDIISTESFDIRLVLVRCTTLNNWHSPKCNIYLLNSNDSIHYLIKFNLGAEVCKTTLHVYNFMLLILVLLSADD